MSDREIVNYLLTKETEISNRIHNAVAQIMRHGYKSGRGRVQVTDVIESIQYILEDIERAVNR